MDDQPPDGGVAATVTDDQHVWASNFCGVDTRAASQDQAGGANGADPNAGQPNQSVDPSAGQPNQSVDPNGGSNVLAMGALASGLPTGPDPCDSLLEQIIALLDDLAARLQDAENDPHDLFNKFRTIKDAHPDWGSWDGHRQKFYQVRNDLRLNLAEWEADERCRGPRNNKQEQDDLNEAEEFKDKEFPEKPLKPMTRQIEVPEITLEKVVEVLTVLGLSLGIAATIIAALADPEPATKLGLIGLSAAEVEQLLVLLGLGAKLAR